MPADIHLDLFTQLSLIIVFATVVAGLMRFLKQPLIMGHIITGILMGPEVLNLIGEIETLEVFSQIGVSILLFIVGLSLSPKVIREVGKVALITGIGQILFTTLFGFLIATFFNYSTVEALYIAIALTFSSTIIILKLLTDKKDIEKLYGKISIGFLLVQDIVATLILIVVSSFSSGDDLISTAMTVLLRGSIITAVLVFFSLKVMPKLSDFFAQSLEFLFLFSIGWGLGVASLLNYLGFSIEIGALVAGVCLSLTPYAQEVGARLRPLREFFIVIFFILLGAKMVLGSVGTILLPAAVFAAFVLIGNPLIVMILMKYLGYGKRVGFMAGLTVAQISEFSLIMMLLGLSLGHITETTLSMVTIVGILTIAVSTYMITYSEKLYAKLAPFLKPFESKKRRRVDIGDHKYDVILFGCNLMGFDFIEAFKSLGVKFLAVDFDPEVVKELTSMGANIKYGDAEDSEFLEDIRVSEAKTIISTIPDLDVNLFLLSKANRGENETITILSSRDIKTAFELYDKGANYVIVPHFIGGQVVSKIARDALYGLNNMDEVRNQHISYLYKRKDLLHI